MLATRSEIDEKVQLLHVDEQNEENLILAYKISEEKDTYIVIINADNVEREFTFDLATEYAIRNTDVLVDQKTAGSTPIETVVGISIENGVKVAPLTGIVLRIDTEKLNDFNKIEHPDIDEAAVFHAWNWSFENIENNMEAIKASGFTAIQTSPVQPTKDDSTLASDWWLLYQPMDFIIGNTQLGDRDAFVSMVNKSNELGMPIIVDVVINHMANAGGEELSCVPHPNIRPELRNEDYWREGCVENWASRDEVTQKGIGLPDLNTSHPEVQTIILNFLNELEDIGVAGFRFDAAKHIELPDDSATKSLFWNVLLNGLSEDTFIYGEIIQDSVDEIRKYASMMDVTGTSYGYKIMDALYSKNVTNLIDYSASSLDAPDLITWVESHDTYANENGHSQNLTDDDLRLGWAILAARKSITPLFFNRPKSTLDSETLGDMGSNLWKHEDIVAINTFRQNMVGNDEYIRIMNNQVIGIERGSKGIAIVNLGDEAITISSETRLSDGVYYNEITSPTGFSLFNTLMTQIYQVTNGKLNGVIPARSVVILTFDEKAPVINTNITETSFDTETQDIDIVLEQAEKGRYRINDGSGLQFPKQNDPGLVITETAWIIGENTPVKTNPELNYSDLEGVL